MGPFSFHAAAGTLPLHPGAALAALFRPGREGESQRQAAPCDAPLSRRASLLFPCRRRLAAHAFRETIT